MFKLGHESPDGDGGSNMIRVAGAALFLLVSLGNGDEQARAPRAAQGITVHQQIIIRVEPGPRTGNRSGNARRSITWEEGRGPRCVPARQIVHADQLGQESIDLVLRDSTRIRARLERRCPALDYYYGFYVSPNPDGMICADRDAIRTRSGVTCGIDRFRTLRPREP
jgi:hypothetical protein